MKKKILISVLLFVLLIPNFAQRWKLRRYDAFIGIGTINLFSDLGESNLESNLYGFRFDFTRPALYLGVRYKFSQSFSGKFSFAYGYGHSQDITNSRGINTEDQFGFTSNSHVIEPAVTVEYYLLKEQRKFSSPAVYNRRGMLNDYSTIGIYVYSGLAGAIYNSKNNNFDLSSEFTSRYNFKESGATLAIPAGIGLKYIYSDRMIIGYEIGPRYVFSDYVDGISPLTSKHNDVYWLSSIYLSYKIKTTRRNIPEFLDRKFRKVRR